MTCLKCSFDIPTMDFNGNIRCPKCGWHINVASKDNIIEDADNSDGSMKFGRQKNMRDD